MIKYSIILATYNWPQALKLILDNLAPQLLEHEDVELIIADDGSTEKTSQVITEFQKQFADRCHHVWHEDIGFRKSAILNIAVAKAHGEYLMFLDGDCVPFPDYIKYHKELAEPGFFVAGNRVLLSKDYTASVIAKPNLITEMVKSGCLNWISTRLSGKINKIFSFIRLKADASWRYKRNTNWKYPKGCNIGMWTKDFIHVNGYDEEFSGWGHEDADLFIRLLNSGIKIKDGRFAIPVLHLWHKESDRKNERDNHHRLMARLNDKHFVKAIDGLAK